MFDKPNLMWFKSLDRLKTNTRETCGFDTNKNKHIRECLICRIVKNWQIQLTEILQLKAKVNLKKCRISVTAIITYEKWKLLWEKERQGRREERRKDKDKGLITPYQGNGTEPAHGQTRDPRVTVHPQSSCLQVCRIECSQAPPYFKLCFIFIVD